MGEVFFVKPQYGGSQATKQISGVEDFGFASFSVAATGNNVTPVIPIGEWRTFGIFLIHGGTGGSVDIHCDLYFKDGTTGMFTQFDLTTAAFAPGARWVYTTGRYAATDATAGTVTAETDGIVVSDAFEMAVGLKLDFEVTATGTGSITPYLIATT